MSRWHEKLCLKPHVIVDSGLPKCLNCNASPDLQALILQQERLEAETGRQWNIPKDEPVGQMNLFWPDSVRYAGRENKKAATHDEQRGDNSQLVRLPNARNDPTVPSPAPGSEGTSYVYERPLDDNEFRLVCLSASKHPSSIVHISLETYPDEDCPDYETVSYAWGGEDGNYEQRHPVYFGDYWDVMLHTKNCWSLLAYLQPRRGIRLVWIDSISINQFDATEKAGQIASMGSRYRNCTRVVVYLGPEHAVAAAPGSHPRRVPFHELPDDKLQRLLQARYFRRIWVVQELILAPSAIIPADGAIYVVGGDTIAAHSRNKQYRRWDDSPAPWMAEISTGGTIQYERLENQLLSALQLTLNSESSDPRDRVFGILGLVRQNVFPTANYDISTIHAKIGVFAHIILDNKCIHILTVASVLKNRKLGYPSWLPDWSSSATFVSAKRFYGYDADFFSILQDLAHFTLAGSFETESPRIVSLLETFLEHGPDSPRTKPYNNMCCGFGRCDHQTLRLKIDNHGPYGGVTMQPNFFGNADDLMENPSKGSWRTYIDGAHIPWDEEASICPSSGALLINLTHILEFETQPELVLSIPQLRLFHIRSPTCHLFLAIVPKPGLDLSDLGPGTKDLFMIPGVDAYPALLLFMKRNTRVCGCELLACCSFVDLFFMRRETNGLMRDGLRDIDHKMVNLYHAVQSVQWYLQLMERGPQCISATDYKARFAYRQLRSEISSFRRLFGHTYFVQHYRGNYLPLFFGKDWSAWDILWVAQGLINNEYGRPGGFLTRYQEYLSKWGENFDPAIVEGFLEITLDFQEWGWSWDAVDGSFSHPTFQNTGQWDIKNQEGHWTTLLETNGQSLYQILPFSTKRVGGQDNSPRRVRTPMSCVEEFIQRTEFYRMLECFTDYSENEDIEEFEILRGGPKEEYRSLFLYDFPGRFRNAFNEDMWTGRVAII